MYVDKCTIQVDALFILYQLSKQVPLTRKIFIMVPQIGVIFYKQTKSVNLIWTK
jgi:hypothetical protein